MPNIGWADVVIGPYKGANDNLKLLDKLEFNAQIRCKKNNHPKVVVFLFSLNRRSYSAEFPAEP